MQAADNRIYCLTNLKFLIYDFVTTQKYKTVYSYRKVAYDFTQKPIKEFYDDGNGVID
jgi:hypothetical protein